MNCPKHGIPMQTHCNEDTCGACYGEKLAAERLPRNPRPGTALETVYSEGEHRMITRKKKP